MWTDERIKSEISVRLWTDSAAAAAEVDVVLADDATELLRTIRDECAAHLALGHQRALAVVQGLEGALCDAYSDEFDRRHEYERKMAELTAEIERLKGAPNA
jgi:hypothetical protein